MERYTKSEAPVVLRSLSFLLAQAAPSVTSETCNLIYRFIEAMGAKNDASALMNVLTTIQRQAMYDLPWEPRSSPPKTLLPLLKHCLEQNELVQSTAIRTLTRLHEDGLMSAFSGDDLGTLRKKLAAIPRSELIDDSLKGLSDFMR